MLLTNQSTDWDRNDNVLRGNANVYHVTICCRCIRPWQPGVQYELHCSPGVSSFRSSSLFSVTGRSSRRCDVAPRSPPISSSSSSRPPVHQLLPLPQAVNQRLRARHRRTSSKRWSLSFLASLSAGCLSSSCSWSRSATEVRSRPWPCFMRSGWCLSSTSVPILSSMLQACTRS